MKVYADNAATTRLRPEALRAYTETATEFFGNPSSLHSEGQRAKEVLEDCRARMAKALGALPREIVFTSGGSEADNQAILSAARAGAQKGKTRIVSTAIEHHAVLHALNRLKREGFTIDLLPVGTDGIVRAADAEKALGEDVCLCSVMLANNEIGTVQPVKEIAALCRARKIPFHTDAVQAVGHLNVDVNELGADYLALSAHKFGGPRGVGALYARTGAPLSPLVEGGAQERGKRAGTENLPAIAAMTVALEAALATRPETEAYVSALPHSPLRPQRRQDAPPCGERQLLLRGHRGRISPPSPRRQGRERVVGLGVHVGLARPLARPSRHRAGA